jgi:hypothetical protein
MRGKWKKTERKRELPKQYKNDGVSYFGNRQLCF